MNRKAPAESSARPDLLELFRVFFKISAFTIGGGYVMFPLMKAEVVDAKGWISDEEMVDYYALGQSIPGIIAMNTSTLIGYRRRGAPGALVAALGMASPSVIVILLVAAFLAPYFDTEWVGKAFAGIRCAVVALIIMAVWEVGRKAVDSFAKGALSVAVFFAIVAFGAHPVWLIVAGGALGALLFRGKAAR